MPAMGHSHAAGPFLPDDAPAPRVGGGEKVTRPDPRCNAAGVFVAPHGLAAGVFILYRRRPLRLTTAGAAFEAVEIVADRHGECQELFEGFARLLKLHGHAARFETDSGWQVFQLLIDDRDRAFNDQFRLVEPFPPEAVELLGYLAPALYLIIGVVTMGEPAQTGDQEVAVGQTVGADAVGDRGRHDLLSAAAGDAQEEFHGGAIDERAGENIELPDDVVDFAIPGGFGRHRGDPL